MDKSVLAARAGEEILELSTAEREELIKLCRADGLQMDGLAQALAGLNKAEQSRG